MFRIPNTKPRPGILEATKLSRLPSLPSRKPLFEIPNLADAPAVRKGLCQCGKKVDADNSFLANLGVCKSCLAGHTVVEQAIDARSVERHTTAKLAAWSEKSGGAK